MNICWVISEDAPQSSNVNLIRTIAPQWGSWKTWQIYKTGNCVCTDGSSAQDLIKKAFHAITTFYVTPEIFEKIGAPLGVRLFDGDFKNKGLINKDDIVALNLSVPNSDIILLYGFNLTDDKSREEYYFNIQELIKEYNETQFVLIDYEHELPSWAKNLSNLTIDSFDSVKSLLL